MTSARVRTLGLTLAIAAVAGGVYAVGVTRLGGVVSSHHLPWWALALLFALGEAFPVHLHFRSEAHSISPTESALVLGLFLASPNELLVAQLCGAGAALLLVRRQAPRKIAFNLALFALGTSIALVVFHAIASLGDPLGPVGWTAALVASAVSSSIGVVLVDVAIRLAAGWTANHRLMRVAAAALATSTVAASLAVAVAALFDADTRAVGLLVVPAVICGGVLRAYTTQRRRHDHLEFLYRSMRSMQSSPSFLAAIAELLESARTMVSAESAEILLVPRTASGPTLRSVLDDHGPRLVEAVGQEAELAAVARAAAADGAVLLARGRRPSEFDELLADRGLDDAVLVALRDDRRAFGLLLVGDHVGVGGTFSRDDAKLLETFASHASVLLEHERVKEQLRHQAFHDALTGLPNRTLFAEQVEEALTRGGATVLFLDLDDFKAINDTFGHGAGDALLVGVAERVRLHVRPGDVAARLGGDEFGVLLHEASSEDADVIAQRLVDALREPFLVDGRELAVHASIGVAASGTAAASADDVLRNADLAMYGAKTNGKRGYATFEPEMHLKVRSRHELATALAHAASRGEIEVRYQPIVSLGAGGTVAFEALARWRHPVRGLLAPAAFVPLAEEIGEIGAIGRVVLRAACERTREWGDAFPQHGELAVAVNLSATELQDPDLPGDVAAILAACGLPAHRLVLELTESGAMRDPDLTAETFAKLRALGVRLALDDFGTGYSSLSHLRELPIDMLKIAKPFVDPLDDATADTTFVATILRLAEALDLDVVAEGIERAEQADALRLLRCGLGQGFHFARPLDERRAKARLASTGTSGLPESAVA